MKLASGTVIGGKVVVEGEPLEEGSTVAVLSTEADETFELTEREEADLLETIRSMKAGQSVDGDEFLRTLR